ncbi:GntR family transcriptional regulator [Levilactobacillus brevis]|uniref:GntR family transcriptional regulator n=1 Tax=Levilactobacillus brevis TaxID=1580 RepID=A0A2A3TWK5_LEVBR|nr:GntR family transcriptional regulator [Levilactobacillus brevis]AJA80086.1 GntR family transcriptional regulator [Levilactobacillus brevis BSO 464]ANN48428.1 GntR family transcriptional regulator [Levilactobacillus brevis]ARW21397.1 HTH-type transcriptional regulator GmuR [Levilactobacillus brevis]ATU69948.1 GntR family transcriptional regulator [Levilactobacillus brevis]KIO97023.1 Transcriptional regulator, GntR family [Levilactobacillus brevis]
MVDSVSKRVVHDLKQRILAGDFATKRLPDEQQLSEWYQVSRSTVKRAVNRLAEQGIVFRKRGAGTFINPFFLKNKSAFHYEGKNLGVTDSFQVGDSQPKSELLDYQVIAATPELQQDLFLESTDFVYQIKRLRLFDQRPIIIETGYIPIKILPALTPTVAQHSIFNYLQEIKGQSVSRSFLSISAEPSTREDQQLLNLSKTEPVGVMAGIFFLDDGTPFEVSNMRLHYQYLKYNTFVNLDQD